MGQPAHRFDSDGQHDHDQDRRVHERREDAHTLVPVATPPIGRPPSLVDRKPRKAQSENVGEHVPGVRNESERVRPDAARELDQQDYARQDEGLPESGSVVGHAFHEFILPRRITRRTGAACAGLPSALRTSGT